MKHKFDISRSSIMDMVSAITAMIARNNGIDPDILWASSAEYDQLDVYYHEAITALETKLAKQVSPSAKFVYFQEGTDYSLVVDLSPRWNTKLKPLAINRLQEYLVHTILHKWIAGFPGDIVAINYADTAASDLPILVSLLQRVTFSQQEGDRASEDVSFDTDGGAQSQKTVRIQDNVEFDPDSDDEGGLSSGSGLKASSRHRDNGHVHTDYIDHKHKLI